MSEKEAYQILILDDDKENLELLKNTLRSVGKIFTAQSFDEAMKILEEKNIDLILSDNRLPQRSGVELLAEANKRWPHIVKILITEVPDAQTLALAINKAQIQKLILKPWEPRELQLIVANEMRRYELTAKATKSIKELKRKNEELKRINKQLLAEKQELENRLEEYQRQKYFSMEIAKRFEQANRELAEMREKLEEANRKLQELSITDPLTGLFNYRHLHRLLLVEFHRALRYDLPLSCMMIDLDSFKKINDSFGHIFGDQVLQAISEIIRTGIRRTDFAYRYGGDEFFVIMPHTNPDEAEHVAERLRHQIEQHEFELAQNKVAQTASIGVAGIPHPSIKSEQDLLQKVDEAMYEAKKAGGNKTVVFR